MPKRRREEDDEEVITPSKRARTTLAIDRLSSLSDEIVLRILSYESPGQLIRCQSVSHRFHTLAGDSELWKERYYARFVRPRVLRIPGIKDSASSETFLYSSKLSKWLGEDHLIRRGRETNWKAQYRLRHNWSKGSCRVKELEVAQPPMPSALVKYHRGMVITLNAKHDLRVWRMKDGAFLGEVRAVEEHSTPTSLAVDSGATDTEHIMLTVGYTNGSFKIYDMEISSGSFVQRYAHAPSSNGCISSMASTFPYILTLSRNKTLSLYRFDEVEASEIERKTSTFSHPQLLSSLRATQAYWPVTVSIRSSSLGVTACIAYSYSRLRLGWNIGIQELLLDHSGKEISSRIAWTPDWDERSANILYDGLDIEQEVVDFGVELSQHAFIRTKPTSLSYSHPYLLASYPDNTLKVYQVSSTADSLTIESGRRLWGHTSGVSGAEVNDRGKAVSVSCRGNDIRIWELEQGLKKPINGCGTQKSSVEVQAIPSPPPSSRSSSSSPHKPHQHSSPSQTTPLENDTTFPPTTPPTTRRWGEIPFSPSSPSSSSSDTSPQHQRQVTATGYLAFDDEQVIILNSRPGGEQFVSCYDFT